MTQKTTIRAVSSTRRTENAYLGCLLGGAVGDALGAPIEFLSLDQIRHRFGPRGVTGFVAGDWPAGSITDDTQMTLFTAEAMIRALHRAEDRGLVSIPGVAQRAYLRWLHTQGRTVRDADVLSGWLVQVPGLHAQRAPGNTCLSALEACVRGGELRAENNSKGCGGVMRMAPVGLTRGIDVFKMGCELAAITHGQPTGQLAAGVFAEVVGRLVAGMELEDAARAALERLRDEPDHHETSAAVEAALARSREGDPSPEAVESLGGGWIAEEALAIGLFCALVARDFKEGVLLAVNHGGDSDSTGSIAGNLLGLIHGRRGIPQEWLAHLELRDVIERVARDLWAHFGPEERGPCRDLDDYPPW
jgi:ADP-ribosylglycohydrolase